MSTLLTAVKAFVKDEEGVSAIEYGLIAALIAVAVVATVQAVGINLNTVFVRVRDCLSGGACTGI